MKLKQRNKHRNCNEIIDKLILIVTYGKNSQVYTKAESDEKYSLGNVSYYKSSCPEIFYEKCD